MIAGLGALRLGKKGWRQCWRRTWSFLEVLFVCLFALLSCFFGRKGIFCHGVHSLVAHQAVSSDSSPSSRLRHCLLLFSRAVLGLTHGSWQP